PPPRSPLFPYTTLFRSVDLVLRRAEVDRGVDDAGRPDQLFRDDRRVAELERPRRRGDEHKLRHLALELVEAQRPVPQLVFVSARSEEHTSELQSRGHLV